MVVVWYGGYSSFDVVSSWEFDLECFSSSKEYCYLSCYCDLDCYCDGSSGCEVFNGYICYCLLYVLLKSWFLKSKDDKEFGEVLSDSGLEFGGCLLVLSEDGGFGVCSDGGVLLVSKKSKYLFGFYDMNVLKLWVSDEVWSSSGFDVMVVEFFFFLLFFMFVVGGCLLMDLEVLVVLNDVESMDAIIEGEEDCVTSNIFILSWADVVEEEEVVIVFKKKKSVLFVYLFE